MTRVQSELHWDVLVPARSPAGSSLFLDRACHPAPHQSLKKGRALKRVRRTAVAMATRH